jgi:hypothetical protein
MDITMQKMILETVEENGEIIVEKGILENGTVINMYHTKLCHFPGNAFDPDIGKYILEGNHGCEINDITYH